MEKHKLLIVEDDRDLAALLKYNFESNGEYDVECCHDGLAAWDKVNETRPALIILDVMLPGKYGTEIASELRRSEFTRDIPIVMLTARTEEEDRIAGLESGADDYVTKPFSPKELMLRVQGLLRRSRAWKLDPVSEPVFKVGPISVLTTQHKVLVGQENIVLTQTEYQLLLFLIENVGRLQNREILLNKVWGYEGNVNTRTVDTHIKRLRQKLGVAGALIETVHGLGYRMNDSK